MTSEEYKKRSISEFSKAAGEYETDQAGVYKLCRKDYPDVLKELEEEDFTSLLDCGCGTAPMISLLRAKYPEKRYTGIDITPKMIEAAKAKHMEGVELVVGDCEHLPFAENSFDAVICCQSMHHYPNIRDFFSGVYRVLKPGGRVILRDMSSSLALVRAFFNHIELPVLNRLGYGDVRIYSPEEVGELCRESGLQMEKGEHRGFFRLHCVARKPMPGPQDSE